MDTQHFTEANHPVNWNVYAEIGEVKILWSVTAVRGCDLTHSKMCFVLQWLTWSTGAMWRSQEWCLGAWWSSCCPSPTSLSSPWSPTPPWPSSREPSRSECTRILCRQSRSRRMATPSSKWFPAGVVWAACLGAWEESFHCTDSHLVYDQAYFQIISF